MTVILLYSRTKTSLVAQTVKCLPTMWETQVQPLGREDLLEKGMVTHSSILDNPLTKKKKKKTSSWRPKRHFRTKTQKRCPFHYMGLEYESRKSRNTWGNRHIWSSNTEWSRAKANRVLPRERTSHSKYPLPTTQEKTLHMDTTRWSTLKSDWLYS